MTVVVAPGSRHDLARSRLWLLTWTATRLSASTPDSASTRPQATRLQPRYLHASRSFRVAGVV